MIRNHDSQERKKNHDFHPLHDPCTTFENDREDLGSVSTVVQQARITRDCSVVANVSL